VCADGAIAALVHDPWLVRRLLTLIRDAGFEECRLRGYAYTQTDDSDYMLTLVERGADVLLADGKLSAAKAEELKRCRPLPDGVDWAWLAARDDPARQLPLLARTVLPTRAA